MKYEPKEMPNQAPEAIGVAVPLASADDLNRAIRQLNSQSSDLYQLRVQVLLLKEKLERELSALQSKAQATEDRVWSILDGTIARRRSEAGHKLGVSNDPLSTLEQERETFHP